MSDDFNIGKAIKSLRKKRNKSQGDIFRATGIERNYISKIENGKIEPKLKTIYKLAAFFGMTISEFLKYAESQK